MFFFTSKRHSLDTVAKRGRRREIAITSAMNCRRTSRAREVKLVGGGDGLAEAIESELTIHCRMLFISGVGNETTRFDDKVGRHRAGRG